MQQIDPCDITPAVAATSSTKKNFYTQYVSKLGGYSPVGHTYKALGPGSYRIDKYDGEPVYIPQPLNTDELFVFKDDLSERIMNETNKFWATATAFESYKFVHKRGFLLYGPQGSGKTSIVHQVILHVISQGGVCFLAGHPEFLEQGLTKFRFIEPTKPVVCVFEDLDNLVKIYEESAFLRLLDGESQINHVINIATTNYPEELDKRISARPRRFDTVLRIDMPKTEIRRQFLLKKLNTTSTNPEIEMWVKESEGLSFASLAELVVAVKCLGLSYRDTIEKLKNIETRKKSATESGTVGFSTSSEQRG